MGATQIDTRGATSCLQYSLLHVPTQEKTLELLK
jgi:hypothetical protein